MENVSGENPYISISSFRKNSIFMRRKGQQFIAVLAAAGLLLSTAACGPTGKETAQPGGGTAAEGTQAVQRAEAEKAYVVQIFTLISRNVLLNCFSTNRR